MTNSTPFTHSEAVYMWSRLVAGHANTLDAHGSRTLMDAFSITGGADDGGSYEGVTRMMYGWGGWLSQPNRPAVLEWRGQRHDVQALFRTAVLAGCDPAHAGYWGVNPGPPGTYDQRTVEAGHTLFTLWQSRAAVWDTLAPSQQETITAYHERFGVRPERWGNNWALFWALNHASRAALGQRHDPALVNDVLTHYLDGVYCGDGWYDDAAQRGAAQFDDYTLWVFTSHVCMWAMLPEAAKQPELRAKLLGRVRELMMHMPYFFAADGHYAHYGRSLIYKFARLGALIWSYKVGAWPHSVGMLKRIVGRHLRWHFDRGAVDAHGVLRQTLTAHGSAEVREPYNATGSQYWAMQAFGALWCLPDDDTFWTCDEAPLPVEQGNFMLAFKQPGWVLQGTKDTGHVQRFNAGSTHLPPSAMPAKYDKFVYSTAMPFNAGYVNGNPAPDGALMLSDGIRWAHRCGNEAHAVGVFEDGAGWLRMRYTLSLGVAKHRVDTTIVVLGEAHIRAHRITLDPTGPAPSAVEGSAALGYTPGAIPKIGLGQTAASFFVEGGQDRSPHGRKVAIRAIRGYDRAEVLQHWQGRFDLNSEHAQFGMQVLHVAQLQPIHELVVAVHIGKVDATESAHAIDTLENAVWGDDGTFTLHWHDGRTLVVNG